MVEERGVEPLTDDCKSTVFPLYYTPTVLSETVPVPKSIIPLLGWFFIFLFKVLNDPGTNSATDTLGSGTGATSLHLIIVPFPTIILFNDVKNTITESDWTVSVDSTTKSAIYNLRVECPLN